MPTVYSVLTDPDVFQYVLPDDVQEVMKYEFDGSKISEFWKPPEVYSPYPLKKEGDFWSCFTGSFAVTPEAALLISKFLEQSCELLPLPLENKLLQVCNVTHIVDCLDEILSLHKPGIPGWFDEYVFLPGRFKHSLFKIPQTCLAEIFCVEGIADPEDEFKWTVEKLGLTGLEFREIWSNEI